MSGQAMWLGCDTAGRTAFASATRAAYRMMTMHDLPLRLVLFNVDLRDWRTFAGVGAGAQSSRDHDAARLSVSLDRFRHCLAGSVQTFAPSGTQATPLPSNPSRARSRQERVQNVNTRLQIIFRNHHKSLKTNRGHATVDRGDFGSLLGGQQGFDARRAVQRWPLNHLSCRRPLLFFGSARGYSWTDRQCYPPTRARY